MERMAILFFHTQLGILKHWGYQDFWWTPARIIYPTLTAKRVIFSSCLPSVISLPSVSKFVFFSSKLLDQVQALSFQHWQSQTLSFQDFCSVTISAHAQGSCTNVKAEFKNPCLQKAFCVHTSKTALCSQLLWVSTEVLEIVVKPCTLHVSHPACHAHSSSAALWPGPLPSAL